MTDRKIITYEQWLNNQCQWDDLPDAPKSEIRMCIVCMGKGHIRNEDNNSASLTKICPACHGTRLQTVAVPKHTDEEYDRIYHELLHFKELNKDLNEALLSAQARIKETEHMAARLISSVKGIDGRRPSNEPS